MEDVTVVALELKNLVLVLELFKADGAHRVRVEDQICVGYRLHLINYVDTSKASFSCLHQLLSYQEQDVADDTPGDHSHHPQCKGQHRNEIALVLALHEEPAHVLNQDDNVDSKNSSYEEVANRLT